MSKTNKKAKAQARGYQNPFNFYTGDGYDEYNKACTKEIKKAWKEFCQKVNQITYKYENTGARDTASREDLITWVEKKAGGIF